MRNQPRAHATTSKPVGPKLTGQIKFFNEEKGYGFILPQDGGKDVFLHRTKLPRDLQAGSIREGQPVRYRTEIGRDGKGPQAVDVELI